MSRRSKVAMLVMAAFVAFVEGPLNPFWLWNALPIGLSYLILRQSFDDPRLHAPGVVFASVCCLLVVATHIAWMFDIGGLATDVSTGGLVFVVAPVYSLVLAGAGWLISRGIGRMKRNARKADGG